MTTNAHEFRVTFGQKYRRVGHPGLREAHPDGWLAIMAPDLLSARAAAIDLLGDQWASIYRATDHDDWDDYYPLGELHRIEAPA